MSEGYDIEIISIETVQDGVHISFDVDKSKWDALTDTEKLEAIARASRVFTDCYHALKGSDGLA